MLAGAGRRAFPCRAGLASRDLEGRADKGGPAHTHAIGGTFWDPLTFAPPIRNDIHERNPSWHPPER